MATETLGTYLASLTPRRQLARCPECGGRLYIGVTLYAHVPVEIETYGRTARVRTTAKLRERMAELAQQAVEDHEDDGRDELYCEHYPACTFWTTAGAYEDQATA